MTGELIRTQIDGIEVGYTDSGGDGPPLLLLHGGGLADFLTPVAASPEVKDFRVIRMVRAGHLGHAADGVSVAGHARHAATLLHRLGAAPAHVLAHSSGSVIALQLAADDPAAVRTLALIEPPFVDPLTDPADLDAVRAAFGATFATVMGALARGDDAAAFDMFMALVGGPDHRAVMDDAVGRDVVDAAARDSRHFFTGEVQALNRWTLDPAVAQPVLLIQGGDSPPAQHRLVTRLAGLLPDTTVATVAHSNHLVPLTRPDEVGALVAGFIGSR